MINMMIIISLFGYRAWFISTEAEKKNKTSVQISDPGTPLGNKHKSYFRSIIKYILS